MPYPYSSGTVPSALTYTVSVSGGGPGLFDMTTGDDVSSGTISGTDSYVVEADITTPIGSPTTISITVKDANGNVLATDSSKFVYQPPPKDYSMPIDEAAGPTYRKVAMNGLPLPDSKPQQADESDQEKEETFVDALTLGLRNSTTDAYLPVAGSDLSVSARRDFRSEVWNLRNGIRPHEEVDHPFGICWSSNLAPNIHFVKTDNPQPSQPDTATVTDETGAVHTFAIWYKYNPEGVLMPHFFPKPTAKNEQTPNLETLVENLNSNPITYTFKKKFGGTLTFADTTQRLSVDEDRLVGSQYHSINTYARLTQAVDRLGNTVNYHFVGAANLVPASITVAGQPDTKLSIQQNAHGLITAIWDSNGNKTSFNYTAVTDGTYATGIPAASTTAYELSSVVAPDGSTTTYGYNIINNDTDLTPHPSSDPGNTYWHADLSTITDPLGNAYGFTYDLDKTKLNYMNNPNLYSGYYVQSGLPRTIDTITMPDGTQSHFLNDSKIWVQFDSSGKPQQKGQRHIQVTDATGFIRTYRFEDSLVIPVPQLKAQYPEASDSFTDSKIVCYQTTSIDYGNQGNGTFMGTEKYQFDIGAAMAISKITDFSGNITTYTHGDTWSDPDYSTITGTATFTTLSSTHASLNDHYGDPTAQTDALGNTKTFAYTAGARIMTDVTDELGRHTHYDIDNLERRTKETVYTSGSSTPVKVTDFVYGSSQYPGFVTQTTVEQIAGSGDPSWVKPLVTQSVPDANGRPAQQIIDPGGLNLVTSYTYDANGNKLTSTDPRGNAMWFSYDSRNRLTTVIHADGSQTSYVYDKRGNKAVVYDENGIATVYQYDSLNRRSKQIKDMTGNAGFNPSTGTYSGIDSGVDLITSYTYNNANSKLTMTDPKGNVTTMAYDNLQRLITMTDAMDNSTQFVYGTNSGGNGFDSSGFKPVKTIDPRGIVTNVTYDAMYRPLVKSIVYQAGAPPAATTTQYDKVGNSVVTTDPLGHQTAMSYDALNRPIVTTHADGTSMQLFYTSTGLKWKAQDELWTAANPLVHVAETHYDGAGRVISTIGSQVNDGHGNLTRPVTQTLYDATGNVAATINPLGQEWDYSYDTRNRKIQEFDPPVLDVVSGNTLRPIITTQYDPVGRVIAVIDPRGYETDKVYDAANRLTDIYQPAVSAPGETVRPRIQTTYDLNGNVLVLRDANGNTNTNTFDALNRQTATTDAAGIVVSYQYDAVGNRTQVTDGKGNNTVFTYDGLNRNISVIDPMGNVTQFRYDGVNKTQRIDAIGQVTSSLYDVRNRLITVFYASSSAGNSVRNYTYDAAGNQTAITEPGKGGVADAARSYDGLNRLVSETSVGLTHNYTYDLAGNRIQTVYGGTGRTIASTYDALNRLSTMTENGTRVTSYGYDLGGNGVKVVLPNGDKETAAYDALNRATSQSAVSGSGGPLYTYNYVHDLAGNMLSEAETYPSGLNNRTVTNTYDNINRLMVEADVTSSATTTTSYTYDAANNRTAKIVTGGSGAGTTNYTYNQDNQLKSYNSGATTVSLTYDANGNRATRVIGGVTDTYSYDFENRLVGLVKGIGGTGITTGTYSYTYDYRSRRVVRDESHAGGVVTKVVFSGGTSVQELSGGATTPTVEYVRGSDYGGGVGEFSTLCEEQPRASRMKTVVETWWPRRIQVAF